jgi:hypothetical protein
MWERCAPCWLRLRERSDGSRRAGAEADDCDQVGDLRDRRALRGYSAAAPRLLPASVVVLEAAD